MTTAPTRVLAAFARALRDLQGDDPIDLRVVGYEPEPENDRLIVREAGEPERTGLWIPPDAGFEELVESLADQLQEQVFPGTRGAWGQARPACPGHAHPARADLIGDHAMWVCPATGRILARIGKQEEHECP